MSVIRITDGNAFKLRITGQTSIEGKTSPVDMSVISSLVVNFFRRGRQPQTSTVDANGRIVAENAGNLAIGEYGVEMTGYYNGQPWRFFNADVFEIVRETDEHDEPSEVDIVPIYDVYLTVSLGGNGVTPAYVTAAIEMHDSDEDAHPDKYVKPENGIPVSDLSEEVQDMIENGGKTKAISVNGGEPFTPDETGLVDLEIPSPQILIDETVTGEPGTDAEVENVGTADEPALKFTIPRGDQGNGIASIEQTVVGTEDGSQNVITITDDKGNDSEIVIRNGSTGKKGDTGNSAIFNPEGEVVLSLASTIGNSETNGMTQKAITENITGKMSDITLPEAVKYYNSSGTTWSNNASRNSSIIEAESMRGHYVRIEPNEDWSDGLRVGFVSVMPTNSPTNPGLVFCNGEAGEIQQTTTLLKRIPNDCVAIIVRVTDSVSGTKTNVTPAEVALIGDYTSLAEDMEQAKEDIDYLMSKPANLYDGMGGNTDGAMTQKAATELASVSESMMPFRDADYYADNGTWTATVVERKTSYVMPAVNLRGSLIQIAPNTTWTDGMRVCFLKAMPVASASLQFCNGEDGEIQQTTALSKYIPNDCVCIVIRKTDYISSQIVDVTPADVRFVSAAVEELKEVREGTYVKLADVDYSDSILFWIGANDEWRNDSLSNCSLINVEGYRGSTLKITPSLTWQGGMRFAFLTSDSHTIGATPSYCATEPMVIQSTDVVRRVIPSDCKFLYIQVKSRESGVGVDCAPSSCIVLNTVGDAVQNLKATTPSNIGDDLAVQKAYTLSPFGQSSSLYAKDAAKRMMADNVVPFILIAGQSNADGRCTTSDAPEWLAEADYAIDGYMMWNNTDKAFAKFSVTENNGAGTANGSTATSNQTYSFDAYFAHLYIEQFGTPLYALKHTIGATPIHAKPTSGMVTASWNPDINDFPSGCRPLLAELVTKLKSVRQWATDNGKILFPIAILWHQGETDGDNNDYQYYENDLKNVLGFIRGCFGAQNIPILTGQINEAHKAAYSQINDDMDDLAAIDDYYKVVNMEGHYTGRPGDTVHYDVEAIEYMGGQMYELYKTLNVGI